MTIPGHFQRGGAPCAADRVLSSRFGAAAAELIREGKFGNMVALRDDKIVAVPLSEVAGKLKTVPPTARSSRRRVRSACPWETNKKHLRYAFPAVGGAFLCGFNRALRARAENR